MIKFLIGALVLSASPVAFAQIDPCKYQVDQRGCLNLAPTYGCRWVVVPGGSCAGGPATGMNPCKYQVDQRGCQNLSQTYGCYWTIGQSYCTSQ